MYRTNHYVTGNFVSHAKFVDDATYSTILDTIVKATNDVICVRRSTGEVLLGKRIGLPHNDWWVPGGRMMPGESTAVATRRILKRELGVELVIDEAAEADPNLNVDSKGTEENKESIGNAAKKTPYAKRVETVTHYTFAWDTRTQAPINNGTADVSLYVTVELEESELTNLRCNDKEYSELRWVDPAVILDYKGEYAPSIAMGHVFHPALINGLKELMAMRQWKKVEALVAGANGSDEAGSGGASDAAVVAALKQFIALKK